MDHPSLDDILKWELENNHFNIAAEERLRAGNNGRNENEGGASENHGSLSYSECLCQLSDSVKSLQDKLYNVIGLYCLVGNRPKLRQHARTLIDSVMLMTVNDFDLRIYRHVVAPEWAIHNRPIDLAEMESVYARAIEAFSSSIHILRDNRLAGLKPTVSQDDLNHIFGNAVRKGFWSLHQERYEISRQYSY